MLCVFVIGFFPESGCSTSAVVPLVCLSLRYLARNNKTTTFPTVRYRHVRSNHLASFVLGALGRVRCSSRWLMTSSLDYCCSLSLLRKKNELIKRKCQRFVYGASPFPSNDRPFIFLFQRTEAETPISLVFLECLVGNPRLLCTALL